MRLLFLMRDLLPPFRPDVSVLFGRELLRLGVRSDLLGQAQQAGGKLEWAAGEVWVHGRHAGGMLGEVLRPLRDLAMVHRLRSDHRLIQVRDKIRTGWLARWYCRLRGRCFVYWMSFPMAEGYAVRAEQLTGHAPAPLIWLHRLKAAAAHRLFYRHVAPHARHVFVQSEAMLEHMVARGVPRERMSAVPMGVDAAMLAAVEPLAEPERPPAWSGRRLIGYLGALGRARDPEFLLHALAALREQEPTALLLLAGDAPSDEERRWFRERIAASGLAEHVHLTGWLPQAEALRWLACAELAWSPVPRGPLFDVSSPTKAVEYLGLGLPCVGNDIPDQKLVLERSGGGLCVPMTPQAFAEASLVLLRDANQAKHMGEAGKRWVREHRDYAVLARQVAAVYRRLCEGRAELESMK
ncbi:glycosyltransferase [Inhella sp.]|uniref:glycosyltransferase n=1 Tax=Inhella sp. TaxID=1921806 RepID=UPI0035B15677